MAVLLSHVKKTESRPLEMLRDFDKTAQMTSQKDEFVRRLTIAKVPLYKHEKKVLADLVEAQDEESDMITYRKLISAVNNEVTTQREVKKEKTAQQRRWREHKAQVTDKAERNARNAGVHLENLVERVTAAAKRQSQL
ncbi:uncharacterized protein LOC106012253 [Aplysia californica]|uniref:Uncharacterized protein LOC106012253 n=1 Tax=Aplysia californica TaxID=6500 RepID=A0ABM1A3H6_APLCA|nr:uncharacterized protein LOC106012253 [Aplysia californica]